MDVWRGMEEYMKRVSENGVTMKSGDMEGDMQLFSGKKRKCTSYSQLENESFSDVELPENSVLVSPSPASSSTSAGNCGKYGECSVEGSVGSPDLENADLQYEGFETETSTFIDGAFSREATPTSELFGDSEQVLTMNQISTSTRKKSSAVSRRKVPATSVLVAEDMPSAAALEDFFAAAEKYEQQRFTEKYNYDIVKDVPLEGKYQWVRLHL